MKTLPDKIVSIYHPVITQIYGGKKYVTYSDAGTWEVPDDFTQEDAMKRWVKYVPKSLQDRKDPVENNKWEVSNSKGTGTYEVKYSGSYWSCTCPANSYRRTDCKHIKQIQEKIK